MPEAAERLARWRAGAERGGDGSAALDAVRARLDDDLDTPGAVEAVDAGADAGADVTDAALLLGVRLHGAD